MDIVKRIDPQQNTPGVTTQGLFLLGLDKSELERFNLSFVP